MKRQTLKSISNQLFADYPDIVTVKQVRQMLGCSRAFVYDMIENGEVPALQIGAGYKIPKLSIVQYLLRREKYSDLNSGENVRTNQKI